MRSEKEWNNKFVIFSTKKGMVRKNKLVEGNFVDDGYTIIRNAISPSVIHKTQKIINSLKFSSFLFNWSRSFTDYIKTRFGGQKGTPALCLGGQKGVRSSLTRQQPTGPGPRGDFPLYAGRTPPPPETRPAGVASLGLASPRLASPRLASLRVASPRIASSGAPRRPETSRDATFGDFGAIFDRFRDGF